MSDADVDASDERQLVEGVDVRAVSDVATSCPSVSGLVEGPFGTVVTLLPGARVPGVQIVGDELQIHVRARWGPTVAAVGREVLEAVTPLSAGKRVHVLIDDVDDPTARPDAPPPVIERK